MSFNTTRPERRDMGATGRTGTHHDGCLAYHTGPDTFAYAQKVDGHVFVCDVE